MYICMYVHECMYINVGSCCSYVYCVVLDNHSVCFVCVHACVYLCVCVYEGVHTCIRARARVCVCSSMSICVCTCTYVCAHAYVCMYM